MTQLDVSLNGVIIEDVLLVLELVEEGLKEGATELPDTVEGRIDVTQQGVTLLDGCTDQVCVGHLHTWHSKVELVRLCSLPN